MFFQICCSSTFDRHFPANFTDGYTHVTGLSFIVRLQTKMHPQWYCSGVGTSTPLPTPSSHTLLHNTMTSESDFKL